MVDEAFLLAKRSHESEAALDALRRQCNDAAQVPTSDAAAAEAGGKAGGGVLLLSSSVTPRVVTPRGGTRPQLDAEGVARVDSYKQAGRQHLKPRVPPPPAPRSNTASRGRPRVRRARRRRPALAPWRLPRHSAPSPTTPPTAAGWMACRRETLAPPPRHRASPRRAHTTILQGFSSLIGRLTSPRTQDRTLGGLHTAAERIQPAEQEQRPGEGGGVGCGALARREGGAGVLPQKRCDWTGWRQNWPTVAGPTPGASLLERGGPFRGRGRCWGDRDSCYRSISVCPAVRRGVRLRGEAARRVEVVSDGEEGERGQWGRAGAVQVAPSGGV